jgi:hypothetical protein
VLRVKSMKKQPHKTKLHVQREVVRALQAHELRQVEGGNLPELPWTSDSKRACCA